MSKFHGKVVSIIVGLKGIGSSHARASVEERAKVVASLTPVIA